MIVREHIKHKLKGRINYDPKCTIYLQVTQKYMYTTNMFFMSVFDMDAVISLLEVSFVKR